MNRIIENYKQQYEQKSFLLKTSLLSILNLNKGINEVYNKIKSNFQNINEEFKYIKNFEIGLISTESVVESWYYDSKYYSEKSIEITQNKQKKYIWINDGQWESDCYGSNDHIAAFLSTWICFEFPSNIKSMLRLIKDEYWLLSLDLPILSEKYLVDTDEVYSWDDKYVLTGTSIKNIEMISIEHWDRIIKNEKDWLTYKSNT